MNRNKNNTDDYGLKVKSDAELYNWLAAQKHGSDEYNAGIRETMERIAIVEERVERNDPVMKRELIAIAVAGAALAVAIVTIVMTWA